MPLVTDRDVREAFSLSRPRLGALPPDGTHYRELARGLRVLACQSRFAGARRECCGSPPALIAEPIISIVGQGKAPNGDYARAAGSLARRLASTRTGKWNCCPREGVAEEVCVSAGTAASAWPPDTVSPAEFS